jgi:excisionase family DNA binding protein
MPDLMSKDSKMPATLKLLSVTETATILDVSRKLVSKWIHSGALPAIRLGPGKRLIRIRQADLETFIEAGEIVIEADADAKTP